MDWQLTVYLLPFVFSALLSFGLFLVVVVGRTRLLDQPLVRMFALLTFFISVWAVGDVFQLLTTGLVAKRAWLAVQFVGAGGSTLGLLAFALAYTDNDEWLTGRVFGLLLVEPLVALALLATSPHYHQLYVVSVDTQTTVDGLVLLERSLGPAATLHIVYSYAVTLVGIGLLLRAAVSSEELFRSQSLAVIVAIAVPFVVNVVWFLGLDTGTGLDLTVLGFSFSAVALWYAISRYSLLAVSPVARKTVVENMQDAVVVVDDEGRIVDANPAVAELGVEQPAACVGKPATVALPALEPVLSTEDDRVEEVSVQTDGGTRHFAVTTQDLDGTRKGTRLLMLRDVTEQRHIEQRYQRLIENSSDMITVLDTDGRIRYDSPAIEGLLGYEQDEWVGRRGRERLHPDDRDGLVEEFQRAIEDPGYTSRHEYRIRHADGSWRVFESYASNLLQDPVVEGMVLNSRDVTDRKRRERELERTNERLDEFASVVSHDLRNPLTVGNGYLQAAKEGDMAALEVVEETHDRMERIVDDALELARQGDAVEETRPVALTAVARGAWNTVETGDATLRFDGEGTVQADRDRLQRLFENLFRNCVEHGSSEAARVTVTVGVERDDPGADGPVTRFTVADDGPGIPSDRTDSVFESGVTTREGGTGFGLAIVESIAHAHGWSVSVDEGPDGGARFTFELAGEPSN